MTNLFFSISGDFITNLARQWFWQENKKEPRYMTPEWFTYKLQLEKSVQYLLEPDDMKNWEGLIAPNGDFYRNIKQKTPTSTGGR